MIARVFIQDETINDKNEVNKMDLIISYEDQLNLLCLEVNSCLTVESYQIILQKILDSNDFPCDVKVLWDFSGVEFDHAELDLVRLQQELSKRISMRRGFVKIALVSDSQLLESYIELLRCVTNSYSLQTKTFKAVDKALYWLVYGGD